MTHAKSYALSGLFFAFLLVFTGCSSTPPVEPTAEPSASETTEEPVAEATTLEGTRVYGGGYSFIMPEGWTQMEGDAALTIYETESRGLNAFHGEGYSFDGSTLTDSEIFDKLKATSDVFYEQYFKNDPKTKIITEGNEFTSFGTTYTLVMESEISDGTTVYPIGVEQWVFMDHERIVRFQASWEKDNAEAENTAIDILFSVELN